MASGRLGEPVKGGAEGLGGGLDLVLVEDVEVVSGDLHDPGEHLGLVPGPAERAVLAEAVNHGDLALLLHGAAVAGLDEDGLGLLAGELALPARGLPVPEHADGLRHAAGGEDLVTGLAILGEVEGLVVAGGLLLAGGGTGVDGVDHDDADDVDLLVLLQLVGDLEGEHAAEGPAAEEDVEGADGLAAAAEVLAGDGGADVVGVDLAHLGQAAEEDVAGEEVRIADAVDVAVQSAEAVVGVGGATSVVEHDGGRRGAGSRVGEAEVLGLDALRVELFYLAEHFGCVCCVVEGILNRVYKLVWLTVSPITRTG